MNENSKRPTRSRPAKKLDLTPGANALEPRNSHHQWDEVAASFGITDQEKKFCEVYTNHDQYRGNGVRSYMEAYDVDVTKPGAYNNARQRAFQLLQSKNVLNFIRHIFENDGLSDDLVDGELLFTIRQNADFGSKVAAIKHYNELKGRVQKATQQTPQLAFQINVIPAQANGNGQPIIDITPEEPAQLSDHEQNPDE